MCLEDRNEKLRRGNSRLESNLGQTSLVTPRSKLRSESLHPYLQTLPFQRGQLQCGLTTATVHGRLRLSWRLPSHRLNMLTANTSALLVSPTFLPVFTNQSKLAAVWPLSSESLQITLPVCDGKSISLDNGTISARRKEGSDVTRQALIGKGRPAWDTKKMSVRSLEENHIAMNHSLVHLCQEDPQGIVFPLRWIRTKA